MAKSKAIERRLTLKQLVEKTGHSYRHFIDAIKLHGMPAQQRTKGGKWTITETEYLEWEAEFYNTRRQHRAG